MRTSTVLVIEDNPIARKMVRVTLESQGHTVLEAADGAAGLICLDQHPDVVVQDLLLPDIDGFALRKLIRESPGCAQTPVIAVSGHGQQLFGGDCDRAGFQDRLRKPFEPSRLLGAVRALLPPVAPQTVRVASRILVVDDTDIQRKLTVLCLRESGYEVLQAADGLTALQCVRQSRPDAVLADVLMPGLDGFELCRAIREDPEIAGTPVVLASSVFVEQDDRELARCAGADGFVTREPDHRTIVEALGRALGADSAVAADTGDTYDAMHAERLGRALLHESAAHTSLQAELAQRDAQLAVLSGISQTLARATDPSAVISEILALCLEATGVGGAEYRPAEGDPSAVTLGVPPTISAEDLRIADDETVAVRDDAIVIGLRSEGNDLGVVVLGTPGTVLSSTQVLLCRAIAHQLCQAVSLARAQAELVGSREQTVERLARAVSLRDGETGEHTQRMSQFCAVVAQRLGLPPARCELLRVASAMHDIGKVATPDAILLKQGPLTALERAEIERHAEIGHMILSGSGSSLLDLAATIALNHHERWDGAGYPRGLKGTEIPIEGRIAAVADVFDALTSDRPYRKALPLDDALEILRAGRATHFDPKVLDAFLESVGTGTILD